MARATLDDMVVNFQDGVYRCKMRRVGHFRFVKMRDRVAALLGPSAEDASVDLEEVWRTLYELVTMTVESIDCIEDFEDLDQGELLALTSAIIDFFGVATVAAPPTSSGSELDSTSASSAA